MKKVSVIIPCYNSIKTIDKCMQSVLKQTIGFDNLEIILVDDASTDDTLAYLKRFEEEHSKNTILIPFDENGRQGTARNVALTYASGEYVSFLDSDDWMDEDMLENLYDKAKAFDCDMCGGGMYREDGSGAIIKDQLPSGNPYNISDEAGRRFIIAAGTAVGIWARIYKREWLLNTGITFPERIQYEDNYWQCMVNLVIQRFYVFDRAFYHYYVNPNSTVNTLTRNKIEEEIEIELRCLSTYLELGIFETYREEFVGKFCKGYYVNPLLSMYLQMDEIPMDLFEEMRRNVAMVCQGYENNKYLWKCDKNLIRETVGENLESSTMSRERLRKAMKRYVTELQKGLL